MSKRTSQMAAMKRRRAISVQLRVMTPTNQTEKSRKPKKKPKELKLSRKSPRRTKQPNLSKKRMHPLSLSLLTRQVQRKRLQSIWLDRTDLTVFKTSWTTYAALFLRRYAKLCWTLYAKRKYCSWKNTAKPKSILPTRRTSQLPIPNNLPLLTIRSSWTKKRSRRFKQNSNNSHRN